MIPDGVPRLRVRLAAVTAAIVITGGLLEGASRIAFEWQDEIRTFPVISSVLQLGLDLDPYEMPSPRGGGHWILRPDFQATLGAIAEWKKHAKRSLGGEILEKILTESIQAPVSVIRINLDGFKGPEVDRSHAWPRILTLGDSTTFGIGNSDYPRVLEAALTARGIPVEVINGGVEGYSPINLLFEMDRFKMLRPQIVTLYIGWNALFSRTPWPDAWENRIRFIWLVKSAYRSFQVRTRGAQEYTMSQLRRRPKPERTGNDVKTLDAYVPPFMGKIEHIVEELESAGAEVVLVTLPGLYTASEFPSATALKMGHLPFYTENPFVLAKLAERYNVALRSLAVRHGLGVIDLEEWGAEALRPRDAYFMDSVHLTPKGLNKIGTFIADQLAERVKELRAR